MKRPNPVSILLVLAAITAINAPVSVFTPVTYSYTTNISEAFTTPLFTVEDPLFATSTAFWTYSYVGPQVGVAVATSTNIVPFYRVVGNSTILQPYSCRHFGLGGALIFCVQQYIGIFEVPLGLLGILLVYLLVKRYRSKD